MRSDPDDSFLASALSEPEEADAPFQPRRAAWSGGETTSEGMRFRIVRPHAQGGIGKVFVAYDAELQREVALKQIRPERADDADSRARFLLEAEVTGRLEHPGIVPVYGLGMDDEGQPFYAMRFVRGTSFEEAIRQFHRADADPKRDPRERSMALRYLLTRFVDVCQTVAYAHSRGVLHRDLKPANILLGPFNESLVVDWGLAKVYGRGASEPTRTKPAGESSPPARPAADERQPGAGREASAAAVATDPGGEARGEDATEPPSSEPPLGFSSSTDTAAGTAFGTPAYMSPEQASGRLDQLGPTSDVYSLGAMLYTLLAGRPSFDYVWCDVTALMDRVRQSEFSPPRKVNPRVPRALEAVCLKAMQNRPEDRYPTATALAGEIERWLGDEPVRAARESVPARVARWGRRHRPVVAGIAVLLVTAVAALSAGIVVVGREQRRTQQQRERAEEQRELARTKSDEAMRQAESLRRREAVSRVNLACREYLDGNVALADDLLDHSPGDLRGWEWFYARRMGHAELGSWAASEQQRDVWSVAFAPSGARIAAGTGPWGEPGNQPTGELSVRHVQNGAEVFARRGLRAPCRPWPIRPTVAGWPWRTGSRDPASRAQRSTCSTPTVAARSGGPMSAGAGPRTGVFSRRPDARRGLRPLQSVRRGRPRAPARRRDRPRLGATIPGSLGGVLAVAFSPDGRQLALTSRDVVDLRDVGAEGRPLVRRIEGHVNFVYAVSFSPDGRHLATGGWDKVIRIWDRESGALVESLVGHRGFVRGLAYSPDGRQLISGSEDNSVRRWNLDGGEMAVFHGHTGFVHCVAFGPEGALAASGSLDGTVKVWPAASPDSQVTFRNSSGWVGAVAFAPDGRRIASAHDGNVRIWDPRTGEELKRVIARRGLLGNIALTFSPDGSTLAATGPDQKLILWNSATWARRGTLEAEGTVEPTDAAFSPDGRTLATASGDGSVRIWDVQSRSLTRRVPGHARGTTPSRSRSTAVTSPRPGKTASCECGTWRPASRPRS